MSSTNVALALAALALLGAVTPAAALGLGSVGSADTPTPTDPENGTAVNVTPGAQLSTVLTATEIATRGEIDDARFEFEFERAGEDERAEAIADRAEALAERARAIREAYREATAARKAGELTADEYARRLAELNARAEQLLTDIDALRSRARNVSTLELEAAGLNRSALRAAVDDLDPLAGVGPSALLQRFLGQSTGEIELRTADGLRLEVEGDAGEQSLEVTRPRDDDPALTVAQDTALQTARDVLPPGDWSLTESSVHPDSGYYKFEFGLRDTNRTGEAEVRVDGSSGEVFRLEVETETPADEDEHEEEETDDGDDEHEDRELTLLLADGTPAPNATVTVRALADGEPVSGVTVFVNDHAVAETDDHGEATFELPRAAEVEVTAGDAELEFEFDDVAHEECEVFRRLDANASLDDGQVTVRVTFDGAPVEGATVYANDHDVGRTGADGLVRFDLDPNATDELELELVKGQFEAEFEYDVRHGQLVLTESAHEGDGDKLDEEEDDEDDHETETEDDEEEDDEDDHETETEDDEEDEETETEDDD